MWPVLTTTGFWANVPGPLITDGRKFPFVYIVPCPPWPKWIKYYNTTVCWHSMHNGLTDTLLISSIVATINWVPVIGVHVQCHLTIIHAGATLGLVVRLEIYSTRALSCHQIDQWAQSDSAPRPLRRTYIYNFHHGLTRSRVEVGLGVIHPGGLSIIDYPHESLSNRSAAVIVCKVGRYDLGNDEIYNGKLECQWYWNGFSTE